MRTDCLALRSCPVRGASANAVSAKLGGEKAELPSTSQSGRPNLRTQATRPGRIPARIRLSVATKPSLVLVRLWPGRAEAALKFVAAKLPFSGPLRPDFGAQVERLLVADCRQPMSKSDRQQSGELRTLANPRVCNPPTPHSRLEVWTLCAKTAPVGSLVPRFGVDCSGIHWGFIVEAAPLGSRRRVGASVLGAAALLDPTQICPRGAHARMTRKPRYGQPSLPIQGR